MSLNIFKKLKICEDTTYEKYAQQKRLSIENLLSYMLNNDYKLNETPKLPLLPASR